MNEPIGEYARKLERDAIVAEMQGLRDAVVNEMLSAKGNDCIGLAGARAALNGLIKSTIKRGYH